MARSREGGAGRREKGEGSRERGALNSLIGYPRMFALLI